jgi:hypothetical protein
MQNGERTDSARRLVLLASKSESKMVRLGFEAGNVFCKLFVPSRHLAGKYGIQKGVSYIV